jgi:DNA-directed RNA polymerase subunit RPC12/RpoP
MDMKRTVMVKRLFGINAGPTGIASNKRTVHECTVCGTEFDTSDAICPQCSSEIFRSKTTTPNALFNLLIVFGITGFAIAYNILTGQYPKEGPAA